MRSMYIDNVLYTVSARLVKANNLDNLEDIKSIKLDDTEMNYPVME